MIVLNIPFEELNDIAISRYSSAGYYFEPFVIKSIDAVALENNQGTFAGKTGIIEIPPVQVI
ncbi:MAG TPA: hypothetical protein VHO90_04810, partial [Bacteroidales bacterium]|nr:hypothetical protein [Bacteroidales bacterium]